MSKSVYIQKLADELERHDDSRIADAAVRFAKGIGSLPSHSREDFEAVLDRMAETLCTKTHSLSKSEAYALVLKSERGRAVYEAAIAAEQRETAELRKGQDCATADSCAAGSMTDEEYRDYLRQTGQDTQRF